MGFKEGRRYCQLCRLRPRDLGGNGSCAFQKRPSPRLPSTFEQRWKLGEGAKPGHECARFVLGDLRPKPLQIEADGLFSMEPEKKPPARRELF